MYENEDVLKIANALILSEHLRYIGNALHQCIHCCIIYNKVDAVCYDRFSFVHKNHKQDCPIKVAQDILDNANS